MGWANWFIHLCLPDRFALTLLSSLQSHFWPGLVPLLTGTPGGTMDLVHCLPCEGLPKHPVTRSWSHLQRKNNTLWDMLRCFCTEKALLHWSRVWRKKWALLSAFLKDDSVVCPADKDLLWVCDVGKPTEQIWTRYWLSKVELTMQLYVLCWGTIPLSAGGPR